MSKVLILLPVLNEGKTLLRTINSVIKQSHSDWVLFYQDNASDDDSKVILDHFSSLDFRIKGRQNDKKLSGAENWFSLAQWAFSEQGADFVCWMGGDDFWEDQSYLSNLLLKIQSNNKIRIVVPMFHCKYSDGKWYKAPIKLRSTGYFRIHKLLLNWAYVNLILGLYDSEVFKKIFYSESAKFSDTIYLDWWWAYTTLKSYKLELAENSVYVKTVINETNHVSKSNNYLTKFLNLITTITLPFTKINKMFFQQKHRFSLIKNFDIVIIIVFYIIVEILKTSQLITRDLKNFLRQILTK